MQPLSHDSPIGATWNTPTSGRIDTQAQQWLETVARQPSVPLPTDDAAYIVAVRSNYHAMDALAGPVEHVPHVDNLTVDGPHGRVPVRVYRTAAREVVPLVLWFHAGGFVAGDLDTHDRPLRALVNRARCTVVSVAYRLAPEHPYPHGIEDAYAALTWTSLHATELGSHPRLLVVAGDSAGGNIATVAAMLSNQRDNYPIALQVLIYPDRDARAGYNYESWREYDGIVLSRAEKDRQLSVYLPRDVDRTLERVSPVLSNSNTLRGLPATLVVTAEFDPQRDEGELYAVRLREAGVAVSLTRYPGMVHGFFQMAGILDAGKRVIEEVAKAIASLA